MLSVTSLIAYVLSKLSVSVFSGATIAHVVFGIDKMVAAVGLILITSIYTVFGGLTAVILTDVAQSVVLLIGCITMLIVGLGAVGGLSGLHDTIPRGLTAEEYEGFWHMKRPGIKPIHSPLTLYSRAPLLCRSRRRARVRQRSMYCPSGSIVRCTFAATCC
eukprot:COSAG02_NODE_1562_length_11922_cov_3.632411_2_plen_161_part_00